MLSLRVNGIEVPSLKVRRKMESGSPTGERELVVEDPVIGRFAIDDSFILEYTNDRRSRWKSTSVNSFLAMLDSSIEAATS